ncbi:TolB family protein [Actinoplanes sp. NPDC004185]
MRPQRTPLALSALVLLVAGLTVPAAPAQATFPGDNGRIAFRRFLNEDRTWGAVFTVRPDGSGERQVTRPPRGYVDRNPDVSPDGRWIAFQREAVDCGPGCTTSEIFIVRTDGTRPTQLTHSAPGLGCGNDGFCNGSPAWSPSGRRIAFNRESGPVVDDYVENVGIYVMNADGSHLHQLTQRARPSNGEDTDPQWSPDGRTMVFERTNVRAALPSGGLALWTIDLASGREHRITPYPLRGGDSPDWSPDGRRILFHSNENGVPEVSANLYTVHPDGSHLRQLTFEVGGTVNYLGSSYSPDGRKITVGRRPETGGTNADVLVMDADATHVRNITRTELYDSYPDWGPAVR